MSVTTKHSEFSQHMSETYTFRKEFVEGVLRLAIQLDVVSRLYGH